ncbi:MAG: helix-turn-helix transcriptional regulator [Turicibacter sp.]|nr:helix-turn-helix transcriptional regulator [Turicibacter sp.]
MTPYDENTVKKIIANNIKYLRGKNNLTQGDLANRLGVATSSLSAYENEKTLINFQHMLNLSIYFDISIDYLIAVSLDDANIKQYTRSQQTTIAKEAFTSSVTDETLKRFSDKVYFCYYYETDERKADGKQEILEGEILTDSNKGAGYIDVVARFGTKGEANYTGTWMYNGHRAYISLINPLRNELCLIAIPCLPSEKIYIGGAGAILSVSRGKNSTPCYQHIILSSVKLDYNGSIRNTIDEALQIDRKQFHSHFNADLDELIYRQLQKLTDWR